MTDRQLSEKGRLVRQREAATAKFLAEVQAAAPQIQERASGRLETFVLSDMDVKFIVLCRMIGHGSVAIKIVDGVPCSVEHAVEKIDLAKENFVDLL